MKKAFNAFGVTKQPSEGIQGFADECECLRELFLLFHIALTYVGFSKFDTIENYHRTEKRTLLNLEMSALLVCPGPCEGGLGLGRRN